MEDFKKAVEKLVNESCINTFDDEKDFMFKLREIYNDILDEHVITDDCIQNMDKLYDQTIYDIKKKRRLYDFTKKIKKHARKYFYFIKYSQFEDTIPEITITHDDSKSIQNEIINVVLEPSKKKKRIQTNETINQEEENKNIQ